MTILFSAPQPPWCKTTECSYKQFFHKNIYDVDICLYCTLYILYIIICDLKVPIKTPTSNLFLLSHENPLEERFWCKSYIFLLFYNTFYFQTYIYFNLSKNLKAIQKQKNSFVKNCLNLFQWKGNFANTYIDLLNIQHLIETLFQFFILLIWTKYNTLFLYI